MTDDNKTFVDLVLERMDTNPEEFIEGGTKFRWSSLIYALRGVGIGPQTLSISATSPPQSLLWALNEKEIESLHVKYREVYREFLRREFVKNIMDEPNSLHASGNSLHVSGYGVMTASNSKNTVLTTREMRAKSEQVFQDALARQYEATDKGRST